MPIPTASRLSGRKVLIVCGCLVVLLAGTAGWWMIRERPKGGPYVDVLALQGDFAVAIRSETTRDRAFVEMVDVEQGLRWQALVPGYRVADGAIGVAANDHAVYVRFPRDGRTQIFGFAPQTSQKLGTVILGDELAKEPDGHASSVVATIQRGPDAYEILEPDGKPVRVYRVSLSSGEAEWHVDLPRAGVIAAWALDQHVVIEQPSEVSAIARDDGTLWSHPAYTSCAFDDTVVLGDAGAVSVIALGDGAVRSYGQGTFAGVCGRRGTTIVVGMQAPARLYFGDGPALELGDDSFAVSPTRANAPLAAPFAGSLDRIEVVQLANGQLVGVDLDARKIAWSKPGELGTLIAAGEVVLFRAGDVLTSIAPATGAMRAVRVPDTRPLRGHHVAGGTVWVVGDRGLVLLDATTLQPRGTWGKQPPVVTPEATP